MTDTAKVSAREVQALRQATGAGILDARRALQESGGDMERAKQWLREQGLVGAATRASRERAEGAVAVVVVAGDPPRGAVVALECETDFVAKSSEFVTLVDELAEALASEGEEGLERLSGRIDELKVVMKENIALGGRERFVAGPGGILGSYLHLQNGRGVNGVLVELAGGSEDLAHDVAVHVAFARPEYVRPEDVPEEVLEAERKTAEAIARNEGKPEAAIPKIVEGRVRGWLRERCLLLQPYVRDEKRTVGELLGTAELRRFAQVVVGS